MNVAYFGIKLALYAFGLYKSINNYYEPETKDGAHNLFLLPNLTEEWSEVSWLEVVFSMLHTCMTQLLTILLKLN